MRPFAHILLVCLLSCLAGTAQAHPHAWIDINTTLFFNENGEVTAIREEWLFDQYYTQFALEDFDPNKNGKLDHEELMDLANENLRNLKDYSYFSYLEDEDALVEFNAVRDVATELRGKQIWFGFTLDFKKPVDPRKRKFSYRIYDPSYYTEMLHTEKNPVTLDGMGADKCNYNIVKPTPDITQINLAAALDKKATAPQGLGGYFAERVVITCK